MKRSTKVETPAGYTRRAKKYERSKRPRHTRANPAHDRAQITRANPAHRYRPGQTVEMSALSPNSGYYNPRWNPSQDKIMGRTYPKGSLAMLSLLAGVLGAPGGRRG